MENDPQPVDYATPRSANRPSAALWWRIATAGWLVGLYACAYFFSVNYHVKLVAWLAGSLLVAFSALTSAAAARARLPGAATAVIIAELALMLLLAPIALFFLMLFHAAR